MSSKQEDFARVVIWVLAFLVLFTIVVMLIARSIGLNENSGPMSRDAVFVFQPILIPSFDIGGVGARKMR